MNPVKLNLIRFLFYSFRYILRLIQKILSPKSACFIQNLISKIFKCDVQFNFDKNLRLFVANNKKSKRYFHEMERGFNFYQRGLNLRGRDLFKSYCLDTIQFKFDDIVIDCGANYGDLFLELSKKINKHNYITFEPGPEEFKCLCKSLPYAKNNNLGLSNKKGRMNFYLLSATGDSTLCTREDNKNKIEVSLTTLDDYASENNIHHCKLLKLEAEGWEPEIIEGGNNFLKKCEFVAIDGGPERGEGNETTFPILNNKLLKFGFEMIEIRGPQYRALYRNMAFVNK